MEHVPPAQFDAPRDGQMVATRHRDDGWTAQRQRAFLEALAACGSVSKAAQAVGMSRESAYALRRRAGARGFAQAWDAARALAVEHLTEVAWDRALEGEVRRVYYHGELVGETRHFDNRLLLALIAQNRAALAEAGPCAVLPSPALIAAVASDWDGALQRAERGEALEEPAEEADTNPDADLELGLYGHWYDVERDCWLTNWPAPEGFDGIWFETDGMRNVLGPAAQAEGWNPVDPDPDYFARTLDAAEARAVSAGNGRARNRRRRLAHHRDRALGVVRPATLVTATPDWPDDADDSSPATL